MLRDFPLPDMSVASSPGPANRVRVRHAATVMLLRPAAGCFEVFTFRRRPSLAFAAGMLVFPGGAVEPGDVDDAPPWAGPSPAEFATALTADVGLARALIAAAVRETFEECGVLLAGPADGGPLAERLDTPAWEARRLALAAGQQTLAAVLRDAGLVLRAGLLHPWAHWLTPEGEPRRFDTRFFVAALPAGQAARDLGGEGERAAWLAPSSVLSEHAAGTLQMMPPTVVAMEELAAAKSVEAVLATPRRLRPVSPWLAAAGTEADGDPRYVMRIDLDGHGGGEPGPVSPSGSSAGSSAGSP